VAVIEGAMGCFDGLDGESEDGSTAQVAKWLGAPVVLVVDAQAQSRSAAAVVLGFERFDPALNVAAVIANRVAGETHARWIRDAVAASCRATAVGAIRHDERLTLAERHLGLVTAGEGALSGDTRERLSDVIERSVDIDALLRLAAPCGAPRAAAPAASPAGRRVRVGVARDAAFCFYYSATRS
jgi:cobyrinic acid a,c-diamide synthase